MMTQVQNLLVWCEFAQNLHTTTCSSFGLFSYSLAGQHWAFLTHFANWFSQVSAAGYIGVILAVMTEATDGDFVWLFRFALVSIVFLSISLHFAEAAEVKKNKEAITQEANK